MNPLVSLSGSGKTLLHLIDPVLNGETLTAQGYISDRVLVKGRVFRSGKARYQLLQKLEAGTKVVPVSLSEPIVLLRRT